MQESPDNGISFKDMEDAAALNNQPRPTGISYANAGIRNFDEVEHPSCLAAHESAREEGSKH